MGDRSNRTEDSAVTVEDDITVVLHKVARNGSDSGDDHDEPEQGERSAERIHLQRREAARPRRRDCSVSGAETPIRNRGGAGVRTSGRHVALGHGVDITCAQKPKRCPGLGLFYAFLSSVFFTVIALLVKTIQGVHAIEISAIRCFFQMLFVVPLLIYKKTGFLGPRDKRKYLVLRGFIGSNAMILLYYAVQQMPLADATVIMFSNPVFTSLLAWIFLKERCTILDCVFTVFTLTGVILIARPPFIFGEHLLGIEGNYSNHIKGTIAAFAGAIAAAFTLVVLRKIGKSAHYYLSVWYYAVIGFIECIITVSVLGEWKLPSCGHDRWILVLIAVLGIAGQTFLTKALQIEKAGPVALMRTVDVVLAFIFQFIFFSRAPTWWSLGGALCIVASTSGIALRKWYNHSHKT
ncbi:hypothetical protein fugu_000881 [Takifugu bimaculatus]|uniref:Solute carrier family 35 member G1 n=1 Tax=Takifugu bimaculatus TaxID=433685 RepID=A0A4Z2CI01_9TELE|nr:hypothetical protein fugu_000881 [Takifugu bimaculatus]